MSKVRVVFMGTPEFAVVSLKALLEDEHFEVVGVVTQPDRPAGRKMVLTPSPVKQLAISRGLKVVTPESLKKNPLIVEEIHKWGAEVGIVVAFGQILTEEFMSLFPFGCVNVHGSLLPEWRGAAPIQRCIEAGDRIGGVTLQKMVKKLDAGDIIGVRRIEITPDMTALELHDELAILGADLLHIELMDYLRGNLVPVAQDESRVTFAKKIEKSESLIDWNQKAIEIRGKVNGFCYGPGTYCLLSEKKLKLHQVRVFSSNSGLPVGTLTEVQADFVRIQTGEGQIELWEVQPESRSRMKMGDFLKGHPLKPGTLFI